MTINRVRCRAGAFTLIELLCVLAIIGVLAALLVPALNRAHAQAKRVQCVSQLRQIGIAFQNFAQDHNGQFPMAVPANSGGTLEFARNAYGISGEFYFSFRYFQVLSNELATPKLVVCPADTRQPAVSFASLGNQAVSYFVGISAVPASADSILAGDRNLTNDWTQPATLVHFGPNHTLRWTAELHQFKGNLLFADGRVEERNTPGLGGGGNQSLVVADLAFPTIPTGTPAVASGQSPTLSGLPVSGAPLKAGPTVAPVPRSQAGSPLPSTQSTPGSDSTSRPGWRPGLTPSQNQPDAPPLPQGQLQPGTSSNLFVTNSPASSAQPPDPGFSLFPPLLGQHGIIGSAAGGWLLILLFSLVLVAAILLKRRLARSQPLRRTYHEILRMF